ncbi:molybdopterin-dependent oxidoreductase [Streptomyces sp. TR06-5]|uniref:molybdopterin-dependent oxidoreductase n=1 Tax=Streptomyces sp. TR06-5 TaxID=3385976 RepID=UPI00399F6792
MKISPEFFRRRTNPPVGPDRIADVSQDREATRTLRPVLGAVSGLLAGFTALAVAQLVAVPVRPEAAPLNAVGDAVIELAPPSVTQFAVDTFRSNNKLVLEIGTLALLALFALVLGVLALRHRRPASAGVLVFGAVGTVAALSRVGATAADALPSVLGAVAGAGVLYVLAGRLGSAPQPSALSGEEASDAGEQPSVMRPTGAAQQGFDRRGFVVAAATAAVASAGAGAVGLELSGGSGASASRRAVRLPGPADPAAPIPAGAGPDVPGLSRFTTPNGDFYRVDTALVVPKVDATQWRLRLHGRGVAEPVEFTYRDLLRRDLVERDITLTCVSNPVGGGYVGNARWIGVPLVSLLREAGVRPPSEGGPADQLVSRSVDGMTIGTPVEAVMDGRDAMLAVGMNGQPLPFDHGFPVRMVVPGLYGYVSACKWIEDIELTTFDAYDAYWVRRNWARQAPIKTESRIDTPKPFGSVEAGTTIPVAGVAWAQHRGIRRVEVRVDGGPWQEARLGAEATEDTWRQWVWEWPATKGSHTLEVRATDGDGVTQTAERADTVPDGATGWHSVVVDVS